MANQPRSTKTEILTRAQRLRLVGETLCDERSIAAVYSGRPVRSATYDRVVSAAKRLGLPTPK